MDGTMQAVAIMEAFGWTWEEYLSTPQFILKLIIEKWQRDEKERKLAAKRHRGY